jgi:Protein of unknown function (DUF2829)
MWTVFWNAFRELWDEFWLAVHEFLHGCHEAVCFDDLVDEVDDYSGMEVEFGFADALYEMKGGWKVARSVWRNRTFTSFLYMKDGRIMMCAGSACTQWIPRHDDLVAEDWMMLSGNDPVPRPCNKG